MKRKDPKYTIEE